MFRFPVVRCFVSRHLARKDVSFPGGLAAIGMPQKSRREPRPTACFPHLFRPPAEPNFNPLKRPTEPHPILARNAQPRSRQLNGGLAEQSAIMLASWPASMIAGRVRSRLGACVVGMLAGSMGATLDGPLDCWQVRCCVAWPRARSVDKQPSIPTAWRRSQHYCRFVARMAAQAARCSTGRLTGTSTGRQTCQTSSRVSCKHANMPA